MPDLFIRQSAEIFSFLDCLAGSRTNKKNADSQKLYFHIVGKQEFIFWQNLFIFDE